MSMKKFICLIFAFALLSSCSDSTSSTDDDLGEVNFEISGDLSGQKSGVADFYGMSSSGVHTWEISMTDIGPQTFSFQIMKFSDEEITRPGTGTYSIGPDFIGDDDFTAYFTVIEGDTEYSASEEGYGGTVTITTSDSDLVEGTFEVTLADYDIEAGEAVGELTITEGQFSARARQF